MSASTLEVLREARALITNPEHWTKRAYARDRFGEPVSPLDKDATCWCALGAADRIAGVDHNVINDHVRCLHLVARRLYDGAMSVAEINDDLGHEDVLRLFDETLKDLEVF